MPIEQVPAALYVIGLGAMAVLLLISVLMSARIAKEEAMSAASD